MIGLRHSPVIHFLSEFDDHAVLEQSTSGVRRSPVTHAKSALEQTENKWSETLSCYTLNVCARTDFVAVSHVCRALLLSAVR